MIRVACYVAVIAFFGWLMWYSAPQHVSESAIGPDLPPLANKPMQHSCNVLRIRMSFQPVEACLSLLGRGPSPR